MIRASGGIFVCKEERRRKRSDQRKSERERERERQYGVSGYESLDERIDYLQVSNASSWLTALFCSRCYFFFTCEIKPTRPEVFLCLPLRCASSSHLILTSEPSRCKGQVFTHTLEVQLSALRFGNAVRALVRKRCASSWF